MIISDENGENGVSGKSHDGLQQEVHNDLLRDGFCDTSV